MTDKEKIAEILLNAGISFSNSGGNSLVLDDVEVRFYSSDAIEGIYSLNHEGDDFYV